MTFLIFLTTSVYTLLACKRSRSLTHSPSFLSKAICRSNAPHSWLLATALVAFVGMTGELTLTGRILPIGGMKEKLVAAKRAGLHEIIFPLENIRDYDELPEYLKEDIDVHFVDHYDEVCKIAFPEIVPTIGKII